MIGNASQGDIIEIWHWDGAENIKHGNTGIKCGMYVYTFSYDEKGFKQGKAIEAFCYPLSDKRFENKPGSIFWGGYVGIIRRETMRQSAQRFFSETGWSENPGNYSVEKSSGIINGPDLPNATVFQIAVSAGVKVRVMDRIKQIDQNKPEYSARKKLFCTTMVLDVLAFAGLNEFANFKAEVIKRPTKYADELRKLVHAGSYPISQSMRKLGIRQDEGFISWVPA